ncbi:hypothetical protein J4Q44_G00185090 [Coregonus suidteri]|uniref:Large ribosomal subunit protein bL34m n=1 Tax=Coregonus suidteri TaxID=861788 RepID=A0AAN8LIP9_9TELE
MRKITSQAEGAGVFQQLPWHHQQVRTGKRGIEYQPKNIKRKRTHGWIKRISTQGGSFFTNGASGNTKTNAHTRTSNKDAIVMLTCVLASNQIANAVPRISL